MDHDTKTIGWVEVDIHRDDVRKYSRCLLATGVDANYRVYEKIDTPDTYTLSYRRNGGTRGFGLGENIQGLDTARDLVLMHHLFVLEAEQLLESSNSAFRAWVNEQGIEGVTGHLYHQMHWK